MIKTKKGKVRAQGKLKELLADFSITTNAMIVAMVNNGASREEAIRLLDKSYETGKMTREEAMAKAMEILAKMNEEGGKADE